jgi:ectoine hydroxylase-related dioxygenase (phytanoyl-CoA dioxygenase family)
VHDSSPAAAYGIRDREEDGDQLAFHAGRIRAIGYSVLNSGISRQTIDELRAALDAVLERQVQEFGGRDRLHRIGDAFTVRCLLAYDDQFIELARHPLLLALCRRVIGEYVQLMQQNGIVNPPGEDHTQGAFHRDLPYQHFVSSRPLAVSALFCLDPFRVETGATTVLPASHLSERFPAGDVTASLETPIEAEPGSFIVFDSMLFHRAGANRSGLLRRAVNQVYTVPIIAQQISLPAALGGRFADDPELARLLGYDAAPASTVAEWRERRLSRVRGDGQAESRSGA